MPSPVGKHGRNIGVNALARETRYSPVHVSNLMKQGLSPDQIRRRAKGSNQVGQGKGKGAVQQSMERASVEREAAAQAVKEAKERLKYAPTKSKGKINPPLAIPFIDLEAGNLNAGKLAKVDSSKADSYGRAREARAKARENDEETKEDAVTRKEIALANQHELAYSKQIAEVVDWDLVERYLSGGIIASRDIMLKVDSELGDRLALESDPAKCRAMIRAEMVRAIEELRMAWSKLAEAVGKTVSAE